MKPTILMVAFGAMSQKARSVYALMEAEVSAAFPGRVIRWAYTAKSLVARLRERGESAQTLPDALIRLDAEGRRRVTLLSLHLVPGEKHREIFSEIPGHFHASVSRPLLDEEASIVEVAREILNEIPKDRPVLVVAHGNSSEEHYNSHLMALKRQLMSHRENLYLTLLEGEEDETELEAFIQHAQTENKVHVYPFLFLEGDHVKNDILGEDPESFKSRLNVEQFSCGEGLGRKPWVRRRFIERLREAERTAHSTSKKEVSHEA